MTDTDPETPEEITDEQIYATLKQYEEAGVISFILPTDPLGEEWVLGVPDDLGGLMKLKGKDQAVGWLAGAATLAHWARSNMRRSDSVREQAREDVRQMWQAAFGHDPA